MSWRREASALADREFDALVVGGGILGACTAWDAALRGLRVALVEREDFAAGTSANSLKILHGGLRYLQHLDLRRMRESTRERSTWLRIAPHLVDPLPILVPCYGLGRRGRPLLRTALAINDLVSWDRNRGLPAERRIPRGRSVSRAECLRLVPELEDSPDLTGGILFHDAQMFSSERLVLGVLRAAAAAGAVTVNHAEFEAPLFQKGRLVGARIQDHIGGEGIEVRARLIVNAAGPAAPALARRLIGRPDPEAPTYSIALNLVFDALGHDVAFTAAGKQRDSTTVVSRGQRQLFVVPWRDRTLIGTAHYPYNGDPAAFDLEERHVQSFLDEVNGALPEDTLRRDDVRLVHAGLLPVRRGRDSAHPPLLKRHRIVDHGRQGIPGALTATSVKFTTGRLAASEIVDLLFAKLSREAPACRTGSTPLPGAPESPRDVLAAARGRWGSVLPGDVLEQLVRSYGTDYESVLAYRDRLPGWDARVDPGSSVIRAQLAYGRDHELAQRPEDLLHRRTELGARGAITDRAIDVAREITADAQLPSRSASGRADRREQP